MAQLTQHVARVHYCRLLSEQVEDVTERSTIRPVDLGVFASGTSHRGELAALNVEDLRPEPAGGPEFTGLVFVV